MRTGKIMRALLAAAMVLPMSLNAQVEVNREKYPDYSDKTNPDWSLLNAGGNKLATRAAARPAFVNNAETQFFPPVFNQDGGSCGSASRICYMFTYELNAYRNLNGKLSANYYPSHFVWLLTNSPSGKNEFVTNVGVPSAATYGGQTYSSNFGNQDCSQDDFGWMQGYSKWYEAMHNRMLSPMNFPLDVSTEEGREVVKNWLWNHNGDTSFQAGGVCGIGVAASTGDYSGSIPRTTANSDAGVVGKKYVKAWGTQVDHALTIVGYDDRIEFDLDGNGTAGETSKDEKGAWIIVNSWGPEWGNNGFIYCPYAYGGASFNSDGAFSRNWWAPEIYKVRKDYRPLRTIKLEMDYSRRSEIKLSAGISSDINATEPEKVVEFEHFRYSGDGNYGNTNPAPEVPMLGRWSDGKLHTEPMEFGYDLTDLSEGFERCMPLKYFFIVETKSWATGSGNIYNASIIDYEHNEKGVETPFELPNGKTEIRSYGNKTVISVIVYGEPYYAPQNISFSGSTLKWNAPLPSTNKIEKYTIYKENTQIAQLPPSTFSYYISSASGRYSVAALYEDGHESQRIQITAPVSYESYNTAINFKKSGFRIPGIFNSRYDKATIEFYIKPNSLEYWNQNAGPGWNTFQMHSDPYGSFYAGWDTNNRLITNGGMLRVGQWTHVALVVNGNNMTAYINGARAGTITSYSYSGIGGFGDLVFSADSYNNANTNACIDELRIWSKARSESEINAGRNIQYSGSIMPEGLIAYYKGGLINIDGTEMMREEISGNHAAILNNSYETANSSVSLGKPSSSSLSVEINSVNGNVYAGMPVTFTASYGDAVSKLKWTIADAGMENFEVLKPTVTFKTPGSHTITLTAEDSNGNTKTAYRTITVQPEQEIDATFRAGKEKIYRGEPVAFIIENPAFGQMYEWTFTGAEEQKIYGMHANAVFNEPGTQTVTLKVTSLTGINSVTRSMNVTVLEAGPVAAFEISPAFILLGKEVTLTDASKYQPTKWTWRVENNFNGYMINQQNYSFAPDQCGVYDVTLTASNSTGSNSYTREKALIVCNADSKNGLNFSGRDNAKVTAPLSVGELNTFTVEWWMRPEKLGTDCLGIGEGDATYLIKTDADGVMTLNINWNTIKSYPGFVVPNEWHHYAVTLSNNYVYFYRDGVRDSYKYAPSAKITSLSSFAIGNDNAKMNGQIDELRIWSKAIKDDALLNINNAPIENPGNESDLLLYFDFNQSSGNVIDRTGNGHDGVRSGFGPDGDAWGLSRGVFSLNTSGSSKSEDITSAYLKNYRTAFQSNGTKVNTTIASRFYGINIWTLENTTVAGDITTGAHMDSKRNACMTFTTGQDGFSSALTDHKVYQTITLPSGYYTLTVNYHNSWEGQCGNSYLVIADGEGLPGVDELAEAIAYTKMAEKETTMSNKVKFHLEEETTISLGLLVNLSGEQCMAIERFILEQDNLELIGESTSAECVVENGEERKDNTLYDLQGRKVLTPKKGGIYIRGGKKMLAK
ncbi:MAG: DUF5013 domain-containing protein [Bacteroidaceae bacterium]|nr:DUF5013 domain-containing protein [Bacteroidaceae bacterium]